MDENYCEQLPARRKQLLSNVKKEFNVSSVRSDFSIALMERNIPVHGVELTILCRPSPTDYQIWVSASASSVFCSASGSESGRFRLKKPACGNKHHMNEKSCQSNWGYVAYFVILR